ncbi:MAG: MMPL family transporter [Armatimonadetes bacterium]|nr:MMPL family transporter [Armatimonadota bacterium]
MRERIVGFAIKRPRVTLAALALVTLAFGIQLPKMKSDTDPKHMLPATSPVRVYNDKMEAWFGLHANVIVLGIVNRDGVLNPATLERVARITDQVLRIQGVIARDVASFTTSDDVLARGDSLYARHLMEEVPRTPAQLAAFRKALYENPMLVERLISKDGTATAIYIPIEATANGREIADRIRAVIATEHGPERYYLAGDPVARDTFGAEMFRQMALFSPIAGLVMFLALLLMFRSLTVVGTYMAVAMASVIWSMGALIGLGLPVHIMSSMIPVFLMAISTDTVHIFNEFFFRFPETQEKRSAILQTMRVVASPVILTDLTTAAGFASLAAGHIIPVRVFGLFVAFGTLAILLMSFTLVPAVMALMKEEKLSGLLGKEERTQGPTVRWLQSLGRVAIHGHRAVMAGGLILVVLAIWGITLIRVNNNMVTWFKPHSELREADRIMNDLLGGTATAYLVAVARDADAMNRPEVLRYLEGLQRDLEGLPEVGKTTSLANLVKRINRVMHRNDPRFEAIPDSDRAVAQYLLLLSMAAKPSDLNSLVDYSAQQANIWLQLKTWDAVAMGAVMDRVGAYTRTHPLPGVEFKPAGIAYFNKVWNDEVLWGMVHGFLLSLVLVFFLMVADFRSLRWGAVAFIPLIFTILLIYGFVGFVGKDFDMPISVLSTLSLGLAVDFAIHFVRRFQQRYRQDPDLERALLWTVVRPGRGIVRNAGLFALGFSVMVFADLTPYITVGAFVAAIMLLSSVATLLYLPALVRMFPSLARSPTPGDSPPLPAVSNQPGVENPSPRANR